MWLPPFIAVLPFATSPLVSFAFFFNSSGIRAENLTHRAVQLADSAIVGNLADAWFSRENLESNVTSSTFFFYSDPAQFVTWITTELYPRLNAASTSNLRVLWMNPALEEYEAYLILYTDAFWCIGSIIFVGGALALHTRSPMVAFFSLSGIGTAFLLAFWIYTCVMGVTKVPMLNFLSLFILLGIGAGGCRAVSMHHLCRFS